MWDKVLEEEYTEFIKQVDKPTIPVTDENKIVDILVKWWEKKYPMNEGQRNHHTYVLAAAFNDYGINQNLAEYILNQYESRNFDKSEIKRTIQSAYAQRQNFGTKYYEDEDKVNQIRHKLKRGVSKKEIRNNLKEQEVDEVTIDNVINRIEEEQSNHKFWTKNDKGTIKIVHILFKHFLEENGFYKFNPE